MKRLYFGPPWRPCEWCGKWQPSRVCRKDRRRLAAARAVISPPVHVRTWRALVRWLRGRK